MIDAIRLVKSIEYAPHVVELGLDEWLVSKYVVSRNDAGVWSCTCADHLYRKADCKHAMAVVLWLGFYAP